MKSGILISVFTLIVLIVGGAIFYNATTIHDIKSEVVTINKNVVKTNSNTSHMDDIEQVRAGTVNAINDERPSKALVVYYSRSGNTREVAMHIKEMIDGDIFEIKPVIPCPEDYDKCKDVALKQKEENARPEISTAVENMDDYEIVFVGYPLWLDTMPMHMFTFLETYDFSDKIIIPFCTSGSGGIGQSEADIASLLPRSTILKGLVIKGNDVAQAEDDIRNWISDLNIGY